MNKKKVFKRVTAFVLAAGMAISLAVTGRGASIRRVEAAENDIPAIMDSASQVNYSTILARAVDFGILAENFQQINHMQTTYAVNVFANAKGDNTQIDLIPPNSTAQLLIGSKDPDDTRTIYSPFVFGSCADGATINIQAPDEVFTADNGEVFDGSFDGGAVASVKGYFQNSGCHGTFVISKNSDTSDNIRKMLNDVTNSSKEISTKATGEEYPVDYEKFAKFTPANDFCTLDFTSTEFDNRVIYVNVDSKLLNVMGQADGLTIKKNSSSVIVFNIEDEAGNNSSGRTYFDHNKNENVPVPDGVFLSKPRVIVDGKELNANDYSDKYSEDPNNGTRLCDREICQKIIWNVPTSTKNVTLSNTSGLFLIPNSPDVDVANTCAGWIVAKNLKNTAGEWHYIYGGGNQNVLDDKEGQIHFAARKAFTQFPVI